MQDYVLSSGEIVRLKQYIERKHLDLEPKLRASILADAVHRIIEGRLPSFPDGVKKQLCYELLKKHRETLVIQTDDVLQHCVSLDLSNEELLSSLSEWVSNRSTFPLQGEIVSEILLQWSQQQSPTVTLQALEREWSQAQEDFSVSEELAVAMEAEVISEPLVVPYWKRVGFNRRISIAMVCFSTIGLVILLVFSLVQHSSEPAINVDTVNIQQPTMNNTGTNLDGGIPMELKYVVIDRKRLQQYLRNRNSMLAEEPYLSQIIEASKKYDIHPLLLFAITGQEQGFVPKDHKQVEAIANNPFNVFGSWESYNTSIARSASIAAKTVFNISSKRPGGSQPIQWLNRTYAEDPDWWKGVTWFFNELKREVEDDSFVWPE
ncbi:glucosaminidase domain-containing protein [Paenibacillus antarcticus]|uniref:Uncharacterized protein n=1 Tax=Paenibacillus antarcticus TaxID=253703 RepID=A0A168JWT5_9BACL|nr:glucosaminidase domain-containing protein [Paenibacillus antarcticus]OAB41214.1 hypothetical protein PBAT_21925 [Paenibacillus antarcticus]